MIDIKEVKQIAKLSRIVLTEHARIRLIERSITIEDVVSYIRSGEIIEQYENDKPFPSCLILGLAINSKYIHAVVSSDGKFIHLITAYCPSEERWENDFKTRKEQKNEMF